ncbi:MAG: ACT domain-containing protein [Kiritimatiellae bacterium]|nr:ACT domain-containing protein [Kiritimatiellia bacterium]
MRIAAVEGSFSVCKVADFSRVDFERPFVFACRTDKERSLVCPSDAVPANATARDDGWRAFRVDGVLDFSLVGVLASISSCLAEAGVALFAVSTFDTDYVLTRAADFPRALAALAAAGHEILPASQ